MSKSDWMGKPESNEIATTVKSRYDSPVAMPTVHVNKPAAPAQSGEPVVFALRSLMGAVNAYEKETGIGGWYAEQVQESANRLLKAHGEAARFGLGSENPIATQSTRARTSRKPRRNKT